MKKRYKKLLVLFVGVSVIFILLAAFWNVMQSLSMGINGYKIDKNEYLQVLNNNIYDTTHYYTEKYQAKIDKDFWTNNFNGEVPYKTLTDDALEMLTYNHIVYEIAKEEGYIDSASYSDMLLRFQSENKNRQEKIKKGEPVYGLSKFTLDLFMEYEMDSIQKKYCNDLKNPGMQISKEERKQYYEENKDNIFTKYDDLELEYVKIDYEIENLETDVVNQLHKELMQIYLGLDKTKDLSELIKNKKELIPYYMHQVILSEEVSSQSKLIEDILLLTTDLAKGDYTQIIDENGVIYLIHCIDRVEYDYMPIEEVTDIINKNLREEHYNNMIKERVAAANISGNKDTMYHFTIKNIKK